MKTCFILKNARSKHTNRHFDEKNNTDDFVFSPSDNMRVNVFYTILDSLLVNLQKRSESYTNLNDRFGFLMNLHNLNEEEISQKTSELIKFYSDDLDDSLNIECQHFGAYLQSIKIIKPSALDLSRLICDNNFLEIYPHVYIAISMFLCLMISNCTGERSFSVLRRTNNYLRANQGDERLNSLAGHTRDGFMRTSTRTNLRLIVCGQLGVQTYDCHKTVPNILLL